MANRMNPRAPIPAAQDVEAGVGELSFQDLAQHKSVLAATPLQRKPLRKSKERPPVGKEIDPEQVLNADDEPQAPHVASLLAVTLAPPSSPAPSSTVEGLADNGTAIPPDTMGAAGPDHLFNPLNNGIRISDLSGVATFPVIPLNAFWTSLGVPLETFDPRAIYDPYDRRYLFACMANSEKPTSRLLIGATKGDDPTGSWTLSSVSVIPAIQGNVWLDFPSLGFTADKVTVQVNMFRIGDNAFLGSSVYVWDKRSLYDPPYVPVVRFFPLTNRGAFQIPAVTYDPAESKQYLVSRWSGNIGGSGSYALYEVTGSVADGSVRLAPTGFIQARGVTWDSFASGDFAPQMGTARRIDTSDDRLLSVVYRNGSLWFSHTVYLPGGGVATRTAAQWLQVDTGTWSIRQLGRVDDPSGFVFYAYPTLAVNANADVLLGCARFSADTFASGAYAYRAATDAPGVTRQPFVYAPGLSPYYKVFGPPKNRWGDYSSTQVDPNDDQGFWTLQEYASAQENFWATKWAHISPINQGMAIEPSETGDVNFAEQAGQPAEAANLQKKAPLNPAPLTQGGPVPKGQILNREESDEGNS
ncbi:MAG TPA: hypothetical protein VGG20_03965 [Thermoanaerobaculia bacterium]|jgi:hypothetical protein